MGLLSALPLISAGNLCCCLWVVSGGVIAAYLLQQNQQAPLMAGDGALVGLYAGLFGAAVYLGLSIPITILIAPMERELLQRVIENAGNGMPPELRDSVGRYVGGPLLLGFSFLLVLMAGCIFSTLGGVLGVVLFRKTAPAPPDI